MKDYKRLTEKTKLGTYIIGDDSPIIKRLGELEDKIEQQELVSLNSVAKLLNHWWDCPCNFIFDEVDVSDYMYENCGDWCEENCDKMMEDSTGCWEMLLKAKLKELRGGE